MLLKDKKKKLSPTLIIKHFHFVNKLKSLQRFIIFLPISKTLFIGCIIHIEWLDKKM